MFKKLFTRIGGGYVKNGVLYVGIKRIFGGESNILSVRTYKGGFIETIKKHSVIVQTPKNGLVAYELDFENGLSIKRVK